MKVRALVTVLALLGALVAFAAPPAQAMETALSATASPIWQTNNSVRAIAYANGKIFVGGEFTSVRPPGAAAGTQEVSRTYLAAFDSTTGALITTFNPVLNGIVWALSTSPDGSKVYVGGDFTTINSTARGRVAAFNASTGALDGTFKPNVAWRVAKIATSGNSVYLVGSFGAINNIVRNHAGAVAGDTGNLLPWNPNVTSDPSAPIQTAPDVQAVAVSQDGTKVYLGGRFTTVGGVPNYAFAGVDAISGVPFPVPGQSAVPKPTGGCVSGVSDIVVDANTAYVAAVGDGGGCFDGTFAVTIQSGALKWKNTCLGATEALMLIKGWLYKGSHAHDCSSMGDFAQGPPRFLLVENPSDGSLGAWYPNTNAGGATQVGPLAFGTDGNQLFVGGDFTTVNKQGQQGLTRFGPSPDTAPIKPLTPSAASPLRGTVKVNFTATTDLDDENLTYRLFRNTSPTPLQTYRIKSRFWNIPSISYVDAGLTPGTQVAYRVEVTDGTSTLQSYWTPYVTVAATTAPYPTVIQSDGAVNYWRLGEASGTTAVDSGTTTNTGTYVNPTLGRPGVLADNTAVDFNGTNTRVNTANSMVGPQTFTIEAWIKTRTGSGGKIIGFGDSQTGTSGSYDRHLYMSNDGHVVMGVYNGNVNTVRSQAALNDGNWHLVTGTMTSGAMTLYVDGASQGTTPASSAQGFTGYWKIGGDNLNGWPYMPSSSSFAGTIDEVAVYPTALSATDVAVHFQAAGGNLLPTAAFSSSCTELTCHFDGGMSSDDGSIASYAWNFGDGGTATSTAPTHTYAHSGKYDVTLVVTDDKGATQSVNHQVSATPPPPADQYGATVAADSPDIYWRLGEANGTTAADSGVTGNAGVYNGGVVLGVEGAVSGTTNTAAQFDGVNDGIGATSPVDNPTVYSEEAWFKTSTDVGGKIIGFGKSQQGNSASYDRHVYMIPGGQVAFGAWTGQANVITSPDTYNDNTWHHVVATQGAGGMALYLDGQLVGTDPQTGAENYLGFWRVGGDTSWSGNAYFAGAIDEVAIYASVLSPSRVTAHYLSGISPAAPTASDDSASTPFEQALGVAAPGVLGNDSGTSLVVTSHTQPGHGSLSISGNGGYTYTPGTGFTGLDSFTYTVTDIASHTATATVSITVSAPAAPAAVDDVVTTAFQTPLAVAAPGVLGNDTGTTLSVSAHTGPSHGSVAINANGSYTYTPSVGFVGADSFGYTVIDGASQTSSAVVTVTVTPPGAPVAVDDSGTTAMGAPLVVSAPGVLSNDSGTAIAVSSNTSPAHGVVSMSSNGAYTYTPDSGYVGPDAFTYTIVDGASQTASASVSLTVAAPGAPQAVDDSASTGFQTAKVVPAPGVLGNDVGTGLSVTAHTSPAHGSVSIGAGGGYTYTPDAGFAGSDAFTYTVSDVLARTSSATVSLTVAAPAGPVARNDSGATAFQTPFVLPAPGVLANDSGTQISVTGHSPASHGSVALGSDGALTYTPDNGWAGPDAFTYTITDVLARTATATVTLTVAPAPSLVLAQDDFTRTVSGGWGTATSGSVWGPNNSDFSVDGQRGVVTVAAGNTKVAYLTGLGAVRDVDATTQVQIDKLPGGTGVFSSLILRRASTGIRTEYRGTLRVQSTGKVSALIYRLVSGSPDVIVGNEQVISGVTAAPGQDLSMRLVATGANPTQLSLTVWKTGTPEPAAQVTTTDSAAGLQTAGLVGVTTLLSATSATTPINVSFDNLVARKPA